MALSTQIKFFFGIRDDGQIEFRRTKVVTDDSTDPPDIFERHHRQVLEPGQDVSTFPPRVKALCNFIWTPQVVADYLAAKASNQ